MDKICLAKTVITEKKNMKTKFPHKIYESLFIKQINV
jgi:hypothetical protein